MAKPAKYTKHLNVMVTPETYAELATIADREHVSISQVAREVMQDGLAHVWAPDLSA